MAQKLKNSMQTYQELYLTTPRMMNTVQSDQFLRDIDRYRGFIDGVLVTQMGALPDLHKDWKLAGDYSLNVYNSSAKQWYEAHGLKSVTASIEMNAAQLGALSQAMCQVPGSETSGLELIVYGRLTSMYFEHDFFEALDTEGDVCELTNEAGLYQIYKDQFNKTHLLTTHTLNLLPLIDTIGRLQIDMLRIEAQLMSSAELTAVIKALKNKEAMTAEKQTFGALRF